MSKMESEAIDEFRQYQNDSSDFWESPPYCKRVHDTLQRLLENDAGKEAVRVNIEWAFGLRLLGLPRVHPNSVDIIASIVQLWLDDRKFMFVYDPIKDPDRFASERVRWRQLMTVSTETPTEVDVRVQIFSSSYMRIFSRIHDVKALFVDPDRGIVPDVCHFVYHTVTHSARVDVLMTIMHMGLHKPNKQTLGDPSLGVIPVLLSILGNPPEHFATCAYPQGNFTDCRIHSAEALMTLAVEPANKTRFAEASLGLLSLLGSIIKEDRTLVGLRCLTVLTNMSTNAAVSQMLLSVSSPYCIVQYLVPVLLLPSSEFDPVVPFAAKAAAFLWNCCERLKQAFFPLVAPSLIVQLTNAVQRYLLSLIINERDQDDCVVVADTNEDAGQQQSYQQAMSSLLNMIMNLARWEEARPLLLQTGLAKTVSQLLQVVHEGTTKSASPPRASSSTIVVTSTTRTAGATPSTTTTTATKVQVVAPHSALHYKLLLVLAFLVGKEEHSNTAFPSLRYEHVQGLVHILQTVVQEQAGVDFTLGTFCLPVVLHGLRTLMISDSNKQLLLDTTVVPLAIQALALFLLKKPAITACGGGGEDVDSAVYALEVLMHMAFAFADTEQLQVVYCQPVHLARDQITVQLQELLPMVAANELLDDSSKRLAAHLAQQLRLPYAIMREDGVYDHPSIAPLTKTTSTTALSLSGNLTPSEEYGVTMDPTTTSASSTTTTSRPGSMMRQKSLETVSDRRHVMISYSWQANKPYVEALATMLCQEGIDVWRDEVGSTLVGPLAGSLDDAMAKAIEVSALVIIIVSEAYKASANCRYEASYVSQLAKRQQLTMTFVMVNEQYTTVSQPRCCDGWLGLLIGCDLWFPMWQETQIAQTCRELLKHIPATCRRKISPQSTVPSSLSSSAASAASSSSPLAPVSNPPVSPVSASWGRSSSSLVASPVPDTRLVTPERRPAVPTTGSVGPKQPSMPSTVASRSSSFSPHNNTNGGSLEEAIWALLSDERRHLRSSDVFERLDDLGVVEADDLPFIATEEWDQLMVALKPVPRRRLQVLIAQFPSHTQDNTHKSITR